MVCLTLTNRNKQSLNSCVRIELLSKRCVFASGEEVSLAQLLEHTDFNHPLLLEPPPASSNNIYVFTYQTVSELFAAGVFVYAALLHDPAPHHCRFKITPAAGYSPIHSPGSVFFSARSTDGATQQLSITQLEQMVQQLQGKTLIFSDDTIIDGEFCAQQLPDSVAGDDLYATTYQLQELLTEDKELARFELRYIHPLVGLGVYARVAIKKGERIASYSGIKKTAHTSCSNYLFSLNQDCLNMELDAESHGNISRFINHAPVDSPAGSGILTANVVADNQLSHGLQWVVYYAQKDIAVGEQLLVCYGSNYFKHQTARNFSADGFVVDDNNKRIKANKQQQLKQYRIMATHGVKAAQYYIIGRISLIIFAVILAALSLNGLMP